MFLLYAEKNKLTVRRRESLVSGSANVYQAHIEFSEDWDGLERTVVFQAGDKPVSILLDSSGLCGIPWEALAHPGRQLAVGVYGTRDGAVVLPTTWASMGLILRGTQPGADMYTPTPGLYEQLLAVLTRKQDKLTGLPGQIVGFDEAGNAVARDMPAGGASGGAADHGALANRDAADQHPIEAITGLEDALRRIPEPMTAEDLRKILNGGTENAEQT